MANILIPLLYTIDLDKGTRQEELKAPLVQGDSAAHRITLTLLRGSNAADLSGASATCYVVLSSKQTVIVSASVSGNTVTATLNSACYAVLGRIHILLRVSEGSRIETPLYLTGSVISGTTDAVIDPGDIVPSLEELLAQIAAMQAATASANTAATSANTAAAGANTAAAGANAAAGAANTAATNASNAAANANAAAAKWDSVEVEVDMLPPDGTPVGSVTQTANSTTIHLDLPQGRVTNATLYMDDETLELKQRMPVLPEVGIDYEMDEDTTELFMRVHGY